MKRKCGKYIFDISELLIQCNKDSCCKHITGGVNIYLYWCVSLVAPECLFVHVFVCVWGGVGGGAGEGKTGKRKREGYAIQGVFIKYGS